MNSVEKTTKKVMAGLFLMTLAGLGPWILLSLCEWPNLASTAILPGVAITVACFTGAGWRTGLVAAIPFAVLSGLAAWVSPYALWAAIVLAVAAFLRGYAARLGLHDALILTVINIGFVVAIPPHFNSSAPAPLVVGIVTLASGLWTTAVIFVLRKHLPKMPLSKVEPQRVLVYSLVLAALVGIAAFLVVKYDLGQTGGWIILTILVVFQPHLGSGFKKAASRAVGTVIGFGITIAVGVVYPTGSILYAIGFAFLVIAFLLILQNRPYWLYAMVLTPGVVLMASANSTVGVMAMERLKATVLGIAFTLLVMLALLPLEKYFESKAKPLSKRAS